ncbi:MAG: DUF4041 domain-containing protein [Acidobacteria bacterium]|nr:DUF4041 domain-containing protein [Acidobacteriota bacterium]MBV9476357.1 DUF4041 domain-containing protein [Acidobacteriota bacterium]
MTLFLVIFGALAFAAVVVLAVLLRSQTLQRNQLVERFRGVVDADAERKRVLAELEREQNAARSETERQRAEAAAQLASIRNQTASDAQQLAELQRNIQGLRAEFAALDEEANLQSFGFYKPHYAFADSAHYAAELERICDAQKEMLKQKRAAVCQSEWTVNGSKAEGRKQVNQTLKLMLRAFNGECDAAIAKVRYNNVHVMETRINKAYDVINSLAEVQRCDITREYRELKLQELRLVHEYEEKLQEEKEEQRRIREQMRDDEIAQRELEKARLDAEREEQRYEKALAKAREEAERAVGAKQEKLLSEIDALRQRLAEAQANKERAIARAQMTRSGHVYVISNVGSFGEHVYKIGMTRRLDPMDRIRELGDASVPFQFDVHAVLFSEDAPALENRLHRAFHQRRVNRINERKEFFRATIDEIITTVQQHHGDEITVTRAAEATEYRKTLALLEAERQQTATLPIREAPAPVRSVAAV